MSSNNKKISIFFSGTFLILGLVFFGYKAFFSTDGFMGAYKMNPFTKRLDYYDNPLLVKGDLHTFSSSSTRLAVGTTGKLLMASSSADTGLDWVSTSTLGITAVFSSADADTWFTTKTTDNLAQGVANLYSQWLDGGTYLYPSSGEGLVILASSTFANKLNLSIASATSITVSGDSYLNTIRTGLWNGTIITSAYLDITGKPIDDLSDVFTDTPAQGDLLSYDATNLYWTKNSSFTAMKEPTGFVNQTDSTMTFATSTRTFTISGTYDTYYRGKKTARSTATSTILASTYGLHFVYFDSNGNIQNSTAAWDIAAANTVSIATVYWDASSSRATIQDERHGITMDAVTHSYLHNTVFTRYQTGLSLTADNTRATTSAGVVWDEDISLSIPATTTFEVWNRNGANSNWQFTNQQTAYYRTSAGTIVYDNNGASTTVPASNHVAYWFFATNDRTNTIKVVMGQRVDTSLANARANNTFDTLSLAGSPMANESKVIWRVIMQNVAGTPTFVESQDQRAVSTLAGGGTAVQDHGTLTGLLDDDHTQYLLVDGSRAATSLTVTGNSNFGIIASGTWNGTAIAGNKGGTGLTTFSAGSILVATSTGTWVELASSTAGKVLAIGANGYPAWSSASFDVSASYVLTGSWDFGGASLEIPNSATCSVSGTTGKVCLDTTSDQVQIYGGSSTSTLMGKFDKSFWVASTTPDKAGNKFESATSTFELWNPRVAVTLTNLYCKTDTATTTMQCGDGTNWTEAIVCGPSGQADDGSITNGTFTAREDFQCRVGSKTGSPLKTTVTASFIYTAD